MNDRPVPRKPRPEKTKTLTVSVEDQSNDRLSVVKDSSSNKVDLKYLVRALVKYNASDLHLKVDRPPLYRINGKLVGAKMNKLTPESIKTILYSILSERQIVELEERWQVDCSFKVSELGRFRCNVFFQRGTVSAVIRMIPVNVPKVEDLGIPSIVKELCQRPRGLILVTGATGSGKSTTLAAMLQYINENRHVHILAIEDPIEYVYRDEKSSITQREVGSDTHSFSDALYAGLRQDPDVIMIGELRDVDMIRTALTAAETGHLVLSTLHTNDAKSTIERVLDVFPGNEQNQVRIQLASTLVGIVSQQLIVRSDGLGRVVASEVMVKSPTIENLIVKNQINKIQEVIGASSDYYKMQTMNHALEKLVRRGLVSQDHALKASNNSEDLKLRLSGIRREEGFDIRR